MRIRLLVFLATVVPAVASAQEKLPPDIHPVTLSRLPPVTPADLDAEGQKLLAARTNVNPGPGPGARDDLQPEGCGRTRRDRACARRAARRQLPLRRAQVSVDRPDHGTRDRSAVRVVGARAGGSACRARAVRHRRREVRPSGGRPRREGRAC